MAAATMTPNRFGTSFNNSQSAFASQNPSMADSLPSIDFNFNDLRERMAHFTSRFDEFIEKGRKRVLDERNAFRMNLAEIEDSKRTRRQEIANLDSKSAEHAQSLEKEQIESDELHDAIASLKSQREEHMARREHLKSEIAATQAAIKQRREAQAAHQRALDAQAKHNSPELRFWEECLGLRIEGAGAMDRLRFVFVGLDSEGKGEECWFEMDMGGKEFEIVKCQPVLEEDGIEGAMEAFRDVGLGGMLKRMRTLFARAVAEV
ncbi:hypothetical protein MBLNU230_g1115t2 [Neophaeotheca triangularis]